MSFAGTTYLYIAVVVTAAGLASSAFLMTLGRGHVPPDAPYVTIDSKPHGMPGWRGPEPAG